MGKGRI